MILVVSGSGRKAGKTSVIIAMIRALPPARWVALKITPHHPVSGWTLERAEEGEGDSGRYLSAGAVESWYLRCTPESLADAMPAVRGLIARATNIVIESNSILDYLTPDLHVAVLDEATAERKESFHRHFINADAIVLVDGSASKQPFAKPVFRVTRPDFTSPEMIRFVETRLSQRAGNVTRSENISPRA
jgi:hypothetical protein